MGPEVGRRHLRVLVVANTTCTGAELFRELRERAEDADTNVLIVAPALTSRLRYWMSDEDAGIAAAQQRLERSVERCAAAGIPVHGALGDADPLAALDDAVRSFRPDEIIIATHPADRSNWLERGVVSQARERFDLPITHVEVDPVTDEAHVIEREPADRRAPARERHHVRDVVILIVSLLIVAGGSLVTGILFATGGPAWLLVTWVLVFDIGLKVAVFVVLWTLFQRRARADRLDF